MEDNDFTTIGFNESIINNTLISAITFSYEEIATLQRINLDSQNNCAIEFTDIGRIKMCKAVLNVLQSNRHDFDIDRNHYHEVNTMKECIRDLNKVLDKLEQRENRNDKDYDNRTFASTLPLTSNQTAQPNTNVFYYAQLIPNMSSRSKTCIKTWINYVINNYDNHILHNPVKFVRLTDAIKSTCNVTFINFFDCLDKYPLSKDQLVAVTEMLDDTISSSLSNPIDVAVKFIQTNGMN